MTAKKTEAKKVVKDEVITLEKKEAAREAPKEQASFEFSDADIQEFKDWKKEKEIKTSIRADTPEDDKLYRLWKEESRMVKGIFRCRQPAGGNVKFCFRKFKWDKTKWYTMFDGETYEVPLAVARHLNNNCNYPVHSHILGADGNPLLDVGGKKESRMNFESTEFAMA